MWLSKWIIPTGLSDAIPLRIGKEHKWSPPPVNGNIPNDFTFLKNLDILSIVSLISAGLGPTSPKSAQFTNSKGLMSV